MTTVEVNASVKYTVRIGAGLLDECGAYIPKEIFPCKAAVISDDKVFPLYGAAVMNSLRKAGFSPTAYTFPNGEHSKTLETYGKILNFLASAQLTRSDLIVALGGGVVGDVAGFCAATYLRGIRYIQIPTTILAACDSSVGGKTAVDLENGKNLVGAFHQPSAVLCDPETFRTLDLRQVSCGYAEIIKYGMIRDQALFDGLSSGTLSEEEILRRCVEIKRDIVERDEKDTGERKLLNFGHTLGHAIEKHSGFSLTHGEAVAIGMRMITQLSEKLGFCENVLAPLERQLQRYHLPCGYEKKISAHELALLAAGDKKNEGGTLTLVLPERIGSCFLKKYAVSELETLLEGISVGADGQTNL